MKEIAEIIREEFRQDPPEIRAAKRLLEIGVTSQKFWEWNKINKMSQIIWLLIYNAIQDIENINKKEQNYGKN